MKTAFLSLFVGFALLPTLHAVDPTNTFAGISAHGLNVNVGLYNTALGYCAIYNGAAAAIYNTAVGYAALLSCTTGSYNVSCGDYALYSNSTGNSNTGVGAGALQNCTGGNNIALGASAGFPVTSGSYNIIIGTQGLSTDTGIIRIGDGVNQLHTYLTGVIHSSKPIRIVPSGDLSMGQFVSGSQP